VRFYGFTCDSIYCVVPLVAVVRESAASPFANAKLCTAYAVPSAVLPSNNFSSPLFQPKPSPLISLSTTSYNLNF